MPTISSTSTTANCKSSIGRPWPSAASTFAGASAVVFMPPPSRRQGNARQVERGGVDVDSGVDLDPGLALDVDGADQDVFGLGRRRGPAARRSIQHRLQPALLDPVEMLQRLLDLARRD